MEVILNNIRSIHNVASIFRTADAAGVKKIYLCGVTPGPVDRFNRPVQAFLKVSLGAERYMAWERTKSVVRLIDRLKKRRRLIFAIEQVRNSVPYYSVTLSRKSIANVVLIMGEEVRGLPVSILKRVDKVLEIPMHGKKESLNVAVAFGITTFHLVHAFEASRSKKAPGESR